ncbi:LysR family transcriptional regulator [Nocardioides sp. KIGAM211]|uniref:LysR family transcriptional regulator n=1 Tax=Nocardioides luti TaxID=2761101 RepID=A0A7X0VC56_9ACTN|nr:LysR family transcriptional regulator [Nocardioides luti]MBB6629444.1 LysR family transcriptional regulator [Nocardioides luti]
MSSHLPDLASLDLLVAVAHSGSIGAAARRQGISQQAASERLRGVESQVGVTLLDRGARGTALTAAGAVLVEWAERILEVAQEVDGAITALRSDVRRELNVAASMTVAEQLLPRWLVHLRARQVATGVEPASVSLVATNSRHVVEAVLDGSADVGFVEGAQRERRLRSREIGTDELVLVAPPDHPWARRRGGVLAEEVAAVPLASREQGSGTREVLEQALAAHGLALRTPTVELSTATGLRQAVRAGSAPACMSRLLVAADLASGALVEVPIRDLVLTRSLRAVWRGSATPPAGPVRDLLDIAEAGRRTP